jgi:hypothetical protein
MKKITFLLICWVTTVSIFAQDTLKTTTNDSHSSKIHTLFGNGNGSCKISHGLFIEMNAGYSMFGSKSVFLPGMSIGMILDHHWTIGATGTFLGNHNGLHESNIYYDSSASKMRGAYLNGGYGGVLLEYTLLPSSKVHVVFPLIIGGGSMDYTRSMNHDSTFSNFSHKEFHHSYISRDRFFVVEPGVRVEFNLVRVIRLGLGISYRYSPDFKLQNTSPDLLNQFTAKVSLRFGKF